MSSPANALLTSGARMVVTRHLDDGTAAFHSDSLVDAFSPLGPALSSFVVFDARPSVPVDNRAAPTNLARTVPRAPPGGVTFCFTNVAPRHRVPMHRTLSLDYGVVLSGEIVLVLDGGEGKETTLQAGDVIVQQGVSHAWHNRIDEVCRIAFVSVGAEKVRLASGEELEEMMVKLPPPS
ncbi:hypothetical protein F4821DRAFT_145159 [Hypoxylon rubiginosum]|uniref:Uncharacterized protein n=1 Tax=Hypoxylon rubiginosum TaxID=110542 RepID=A0ACC0CZS7_9PEZI|nr:hypothetical protein F4821DRAFT_145159 [Hypoxylon rubiginosum]